MWTYSCLWSSDAIWRHIAISGSTLAQVMTCCLTAPNHCLKQCWLLISGVRWYSPESNFIASSPATNLQNEFENNTFWTCWNVSQCQWDKYHKRQKQIYVVHLPRKAYCALRYNYVTLAWGQQNRIVALSDDSWKVSKDTVSSWRRYLTVVVWSASRAYSISQEICTRFLLCCALLWLYIDWFPISIRLTSLALWQSNDCPSASKATLMNMDEYFMWIHYEQLHNHNKAKHNKTVCIFLGIHCMMLA